MSLLRDKLKDAVLALSNDEKQWNQFDITKVAQAAHDAVEPEITDLKNQIAALQAGADPELAGKITELQTALTAAQTELDEVKTNQGTDEDTISDHAGVLSDLLDAIKNGGDITAAVTAAQAVVDPDAAAPTAPVVVAAPTDGTDATKAANDTSGTDTDGAKTDAQ